ALKLGFTPGPKLREAVEDEIEWWGEVKELSFHDTAYYYKSRTPTDPTWARICALEGIDAALTARRIADDGDVKLWIELVDSYLAVLRRSLPHAATQRPP